MAVQFFCGAVLFPLGREADFHRMADRELKKLSRAELIDIIYALKEREDDLSAQVAALEEKLAQREIQISRAGSIAEAALAINRVFEQAQAAAEDYLLSVRAGAAAGTLIPEEKKPEPVEDLPAPVSDPGTESDPLPESIRVPKPEKKTELARRRFEDRLSGLVKRTGKGREQV